MLAVYRISTLSPISLAYITHWVFTIIKDVITTHPSVIGYNEFCKM